MKRRLAVFCVFAFLAGICFGAPPSEQTDLILRNGKVVTAQRTDPLEEGDHHDPIKMKEFLTKWVAPSRDAREVLGTALTRAASEDKQVLLHFGAPWCGW